MVKEELEKEAREYIAEHSEYSEVFEQTFVAIDTLTAMVDFAEPREKQIAELKERISTLEQIKKEYTDYTIKVEEERTFAKEQLIKAKELLKKLLVHSKRYIWIADDNNKPIMQKEIAEAEQFLKEVEE